MTDDPNSLLAPLPSSARRELNRMGWRQLFFSIKGRMGRYDYWVRATLPMLLASLGIAILLALLFAGRHDGTDTVSGMVSLLLLYPSVCVYAKRWHDRNKSAWWTLILLVPVIGILWVIIELGFLRGTVGPNRFGPDPLD